MSPYLRDKNWRISYSSNENNPIAGFYIPALECAIQYDRKSGFFSSVILSKVARGLGAMLHQEGRMRLIMGCQFSPEDLQAIQQGYELRDALLTRLDTDLKPPENFAQLKHFEILSWLIQNGYLDIKIAIPLKLNGIPEDSHVQLDPHHIFHEKVGIFTDANGDQLAFSGSNNESLGGWEKNVESFHVYCAWEEGRELERVQEEIFRFEQLWHNLAPNVQVFEVPEAVQKKLLSYAPATKPTWDKRVEFDNRPLSVNSEEIFFRSASVSLASNISNEIVAQKSTSVSLASNNISEFDKLASEMLALPINEQCQQEKTVFEQLTNLYQHPGCLDFCLKSIPISPWPHQIKILQRVAQKFPHSFLIADEVGLGKTIETGLILRYLLVSQKVKRVLILAPASVQPQWQEELREKFNLHFWSYNQGIFKYPYSSLLTNNNQSIITNPWNTTDLILASSYLVRRTERMQQLLNANPWDLIILVEWIQLFFLLSLDSPVG